MALSESKLLDMLFAAEASLDKLQERLWDCLKISPEQWLLPSGNKAWAVGLIGQRVIWYNECEYGYNLSNFRVYGQIGECNGSQDELAECLQNVLNWLQSGYQLPYCSPPIMGKYRA